jgi:hypothetical protein
MNAAAMLVTASLFVGAASLAATSGTDMACLDCMANPKQGGACSGKSGEACMQCVQSKCGAQCGASLAVEDVCYGRKAWPTPPAVVPVAPVAPVAPAPSWIDWDIWPWNW